MEIAVLLAAGLQEWIDFGVIIAILLLNATVGWYQEKQAADVVASLKGDIVSFNSFPFGSISFSFFFCLSKCLTPLFWSVAVVSTLILWKTR